MTDFLEMAMADIDEVFFQEFVEKHTIDGEEFDVVPYEVDLRERKSHWEAGAKKTSTKACTFRKSNFLSGQKIMVPLRKSGNRWSMTTSHTR